MVIFCSSKKKLRKIRNILSNELLKHGLSVKGNWQIFRFDYSDKHGRCVDFMGYKFYRNRTILRKSILCNIRRKALNIWHKEKATVYDARQSLSSLGWIKSSNIYNYYKKGVSDLYRNNTIIIRHQWKKVEIEIKKIIYDISS